MKHVSTFLVLFLMAFSSFGQSGSDDVAVGDLFSIQKQANMPFDHIHFPKANFIIKQGGIANFQNLDDVKVKVVAVLDNGLVKLAPVSGKKFFNRYMTVKADMEKALQAGELQKIDLRHNGAMGAK